METDTSTPAQSIELFHDNRYRITEQPCEQEGHFRITIDRLPQEKNNSSDATTQGLDRFGIHTTHWPPTLWRDGAKRPLFLDFDHDTLQGIPGEGPLVSIVFGPRDVLEIRHQAGNINRLHY